MPDYFDDNELLKMFSSDPEEHAGGPSEIESFLGCAKRERLKRERQQEEGIAFDVLGRRTAARNIGTITHKLVELYHDGERTERVFPEHSEHPEIDELLQEGWRLFRKYEDAYPLGFWGKLIGTEVKLPGGGRVDAIFDVDAEAAANINEKLGTRVEPGLMVWDLKTGSQRDNHLHEKYEWKLAGTVYCNRVETALGVAPTTFFIFLAVRYKRADTKWDFGAAFSAARMMDNDAQLRLENAKMLGEMLWNTGRANIMRCHDWGACPFKEDGTCKGY
jgi:hypothetical protein